MANSGGKSSNLISRTVNGVLSPLGLKVRRRDALDRMESELGLLQDRSHLHLEAVKDLILFACEFIFPDLSPVEKRAELMLGFSGTGYLESLYIADCLRKSGNIPGDVCEFGVARGGTSAFIANEISKTDKNLWLFDSFEGLPRPTEKDILINDYLNLGSMEAYEGEMMYPVDEVKVRLEAISFPASRTKIVPGFIEETIHGADLPNEVCFAYVDFDLYEPIAIALDFLSQHLSPGGSIVVDDYGYFSSGAKTAVEEFAVSHANNFEMSLPFTWTTTGDLVGTFAIITRTS